MSADLIWVAALLWWAAGLAILAFMIWLVVKIVKLAWYGGNRREPGPPKDSALEILRERYARGEIDAAEYEERLRRLGG